MYKRQVPDDVSIIGFDDLPIAAYTSPPLTTIRQDRIELGKSGFFALSSLLNGVSISTFLLHTQLIERKSTGKDVYKRQVYEEINIQNTGGTDYAEQIIFKGSRYM